MINDQLRAVIDRALDRERISAEDVRRRAGRLPGGRVVSMTLP
jgi:hypothetical protein